MAHRSRTPFSASLALLIGFTFGLASAARADDIPLRNWSAPKSWTPSATSGTRRLMGDLSNPAPFIPITPCRLADTRGLGFTGQAGPPHVTANTSRDFQVAGTVVGIPTQCGIPAGAYAASLNFTVVNMTSNGNLIAWPTGAAQPNTSELNWSAASSVVGNAAVVPISAAGSVRVLANAPNGATVDLIIDVNGYYAAFIDGNEGFGVAGNTAGNAVIYGHNAAATGYGIWGDSTGGYGVYGSSLGSGFSAGVYGFSPNGLGVYAVSGISNGLWAQSTSWDALAAFGGRYGSYSEGGVIGAVGTDSGHLPAGGDALDATVGVLGGTISGTGVIGVAQLGSGSIAASFHKLNSASPYGDTTHVTLCPSGTTAANFFGNVNINAAVGAPTTGDLAVIGTVSKGGGSFKIDHPLDPENKYLYHSFVESPDMMNVYNGNVVLDSQGEATVELPDYFEALNSDYRYQLTSIGRFSPVYVAEKISGNRFRIAGGQAGAEVSWQVTGIRQDAFARAHRIQVEVEKEPELKGTYLHPVELGKPVERSSAPIQERVEREREKEARQTTKSFR
jgi:hypothetical protein